MKQIPLTKGKFALVDDEDYIFLIQWKWSCNVGYAVRYERGVPVLMHRFIMSTPKGMSTDHIDGDRLNNQKLNLRICTHAENMRNTTNIRKNNSSGFKGVSWCKRSNKWVAAIKINNKSKNLGRFNRAAEAAEAAEAYNKASKELHKDFANPNTL